jgi:mRNA-degrading endonuclease toxin of MazEF toxin-antitoxin module
MKRMPSRGEIWYVKLPTDPPEKAASPVIIVSLDARNRHLSQHGAGRTPDRLCRKGLRDASHSRLGKPETGLHASSIRCEDVTVVKKESLVEPKFPLRVVSNTRVCLIADAVRIAMGCSK